MRRNTILLAIIIVSLTVLFRPAGRITFDKSVSENRILFQYEMFGCGSIVGKILDGGEEIAAEYMSDYPEIGLNEVVFAEDSDEPQKVFDSVDFHHAGLAERYTYIIEGEAVGVTEGARDCCEDKPAYNDHVVEFKVDEWYFTSYVPYHSVGNILVIAFAWVVLSISAIYLIVLIFTKKSSKI